MSKTYSNLRVVENTEDGSWSIYATWFDDDDGADGGPIGNIEWEVPEWTGLESKAEALAVIRGYEEDTLPDDMKPRHPHYHA